MIREAIILAGGLGTRLRSVTGEVPKPMALVRGKPFLAYQLEYLHRWGLRTVVLSVGYHYEVIRAFFCDQYCKMRIMYSIEDEPHGTGGGVLKAMELITGGDVCVMNGDSYFEMDLDDFYAFHQRTSSPLSIALCYQPDTGRYGIVTTDDQDRITGFREKDHASTGGWINGGIYFINKAFYTECAESERFSLERDFLPRCISRHVLYGYTASGYFIDIGTPEDYRRAQDEFTRFEH